MYFGGSVFHLVCSSTKMEKRYTHGRTNKDGTTRKVSYVMHCIPFAYRCVCRKVKKKETLDRRQKNGMEYFSVTRYLFSLICDTDNDRFRLFNSYAHYQTHIPQPNSVLHMQNESISICYLPFGCFVF